MNLSLKSIDYDFAIAPGHVYNLVLKNKTALFRLVRGLSVCSEEMISIYDNGSKDIKKLVIPLAGILEMNSNTRKVLTSTYKEIDIRKSDALMEKLNSVNKSIAELMDLVAMDCDFSCVYDADLKLSDLLAACSFKYSFQEDDFLQTFVSYLKSQLLIAPYKVIFTYRINDFLNAEQHGILRKELSFLGLTLVDISGSRPPEPFGDVVVIDEDLCALY